MGKSSIHMQTATAGTILHNARENYSKSVVFTDEVNELWNDSKKAYKLYREELAIRSEAYTRRTKQKLQKNTSTMISAVINLEQHHTLKDLEDLKNYIEKEFDTKIIQMAIHRDEGKLINKNNPLNKLVSGKDFFLNSKDNELYFDSKFTQKINMNEWEIEKNYHAHFEMLGIDSDGNSLRKKMNLYKLSQMQDFTAKSLKMERGNNNVEVVKENGVEKAKRKTTRNKKRLDTHEYKEQAKIINDFNVASDKEKQLLIEQAKNVIEENKKTKEEKAIAKKELEELKITYALARSEFQNAGAKREDYARLEQLNKQLQEQLKNKDTDLINAKKDIEDLKIKLLNRDLVIEDLKSEVYNNEYTQNNKPMKNIDLANHFINENDKKDIEINKLENQINIFKNQNKSLQEQNSILESKVITLEDKINSRANMNDYKLEYFIEVGKNEELEKMNEELKEENEELKEENKTLKSTISNFIDKVVIQNLTSFFKDIKELYGEMQLRKSEKDRLENLNKKEDTKYYNHQDNFFHR